MHYKAILILFGILALVGLLYFGQTILNYSDLHPSTPTSTPLPKVDSKEYQAYIKNKPTFIFLKENTNSETTSVLTQQIKQNQGVKEVRYISTEDAIQSYKEINKNNKELLQIMPSTLPASLEVYIETSLTSTEYKQLTDKISTIANNFSFVTNIIIPER